MFLPMMGFFFTLVVLGSLASLVARFDPEAAHRAPLSYAVLFAGLSAILFVILGGLVSEYVHESVGTLIVMFLAPTVGLGIGAALGYRLGVIRQNRSKRREHESYET